MGSCTYTNTLSLREVYFVNRKDLPACESSWAVSMGCHHHDHGSRETLSDSDFHLYRKVLKPGEGVYIYTKVNYHALFRTGSGKLKQLCSTFRERWVKKIQNTNRNYPEARDDHLLT